jgi:hypothetical protein
MRRATTRYLVADGGWCRRPLGGGLFGQIQRRWCVFVSEVVSIVLRKVMSAQLRRSLKSTDVFGLKGKDVGFVTS